VAATLIQEIMPIKLDQPEHFNELHASCRSDWHQFLSPDALPAVTFDLAINN
tara:strand:+ start:369 stop:524 length:156 start_codon:yes stop_codon:yes gene_type:complete